MMQQVALLARYAESLFWMARYMERLENLARLIDVTQTFESPGLENEAWDALVRIHADETHFAERYGTPSADTVKRYYLLDKENPNSIAGSIEAARMNARTLRPLISTEMWKNLNVFHRDLLEVQEHELQGDSLSRLCTRIKEGVQAHTGITSGTLFRDQGWHFYEMGRLIERADQTTRLLDIKFHRLAPDGLEEKRLEERTQSDIHETSTQAAPETEHCAESACSFSAPADPLTQMIATDSSNFVARSPPHFLTWARMTCSSMLGRFVDRRLKDHSSRARICNDVDPMHLMIHRSQTFR